MASWLHGFIESWFSELISLSLIMRKGRQMANRRGLTLVEILVSIAIVGMLVAVLLPAVQVSRASARRVQCQNNLKQLALAVTNYESAHRLYPAAHRHGLSWHVAILPQIDQNELFKKVDFDLATSDPDAVAKELGKHRITVFECPADGTLHPRSASTNYLGSAGTSGLTKGCDGVFCLDAYHTTFNGPVSAANIRDGLSQTSLISEVLHGNGTITSRFRVHWQTPISYSPSQFPAFRSVCEAIPDDAPVLGWLGNPNASGARWALGSLGYSTYNHSSTPLHPACTNAGHVPTGIYPASSSHSHAVNVAFCDGSARTVADAIDITVWTALGSRASGETFELP